MRFLPYKFVCVWKLTRTLLGPTKSQFITNDSVRTGSTDYFNREPWCPRDCTSVLVRLASATHGGSMPMPIGKVYHGVFIALSVFEWRASVSWGLHLGVSVIAKLNWHQSRIRVVEFIRYNGNGQDDIIMQPIWEFFYKNIIGQSTTLIRKDLPGLNFEEEGIFGIV